MSGNANPKHEIAAPGRVDNLGSILQGFDSDIDVIAKKIAQSTVFQGVDIDKIRDLVEMWFNTGHWWEPDALDLVLFLEGEL